VFDDGGLVLGYGAVESDERGEYRVFVVTTPQCLSTVGDALYCRALDVLKEAGATRVWFSEYASDTSLLEFARYRGFSEVVRRELPNGAEMLTLCKNLRPDEASNA
jgi:hypothetical protein